MTDTGMALSQKQIVTGLRALCKCAKPYRGCVLCMAATLIERLDREPLTMSQADRLVGRLHAEIPKAVYACVTDDERTGLERGG